jgi:hypothetical protein
VAVAWAAGLRPPGTALARSLADRLVCAVRQSAGCRPDPEIYAAYGGELAELVRANAPEVLYENGMTALPVDYRRCRSDGCAAGEGAGEVDRSDTGEQVTLFTHVVDCRDPDSAAADCSGPRAGRIYIQYFAYYPGSATAEGVLLRRQVRRLSAAAGRPSFHADDWEGVQVRINPDGSVDSRASSHNGYNGGGGIANWGSDAGSSGAARAAEAAGFRDAGGWTPSRGAYYVSGGSHAGHVDEASARRAAATALSGAILRSRGASPRGFDERRDRLASRIERALDPAARRTPGDRIRLVPIESLSVGDRAATFAITPPWRKRVYLDPEYTGTN